MKNIVLCAVIGAIVGVVGFSILGGKTSETIIEKFGVAAGPLFTEHIQFLEGFTEGGNAFATSSAGAATYTASNLNEKVTLVQHTATAALTATLPASSTINWIPRAGDRRTIFFAPITTGITFAGGTGTDLNTASSTKFIIAGTVGRMDFIRKVNTDIEVLLVSPTGL